MFLIKEDKIMAFIDYYKILGVDRNIPQKDVRAAYRKRAKLFHPDLHPNDAACAEKFKEINEAYSVVGDADKRAKYDRGEMDDQGNFGGGYNPFGGQGFTAIIIAWLSKFNTFVMVFVTFLLIFLERGAAEIASRYDLNSYASQILTGIILFFILGSEFFINYQIKFRSKAQKEAA